MDLESLKIDRSSETRFRSANGGRGMGRIVLLIIVLVLGWLFRAPVMGFVDDLRLPSVEVIVVQRTSPLAASAVSGTAANGYVVARVRAALSADTPGRIVEMDVEEGSVVKQGDVVARLYSDEYRAALHRADAQLKVSAASIARAEAQVVAQQGELDVLSSNADAAAARRESAAAHVALCVLNVDRANKLYDQNIQTQQMVDEAVTALDQANAAYNAQVATYQAAIAAHANGNANLEVARATVKEAAARLAVDAAGVEQAQATLDKTEVRAPFDGIIVLKDAEVGEVVSPNSSGGNARGSVVTMVDLASLEVQVDVPESTLSAVKQGAPANIYLDAWPETGYTGRVERIWPTANRQKATIEVRVVFDNPDDKLRPEMGARVVFTEVGSAISVTQSAEPRVLVPEATIVAIDGQSGVFELERDIARWRPVVPGDSRNGRVAIESGLEGGERIVRDPPTELMDGDRVRVQE